MAALQISYRTVSRRVPTRNINFCHVSKQKPLGHWQQEEGIIQWRPLVLEYFNSGRVGKRVGQMTHERKVEREEGSNPGYMKQYVDLAVFSGLSYSLKYCFFVNNTLLNVLLN